MTIYSVLIILLMVVTLVIFDDLMISILLTTLGAGIVVIMVGVLTPSPNNDDNIEPQPSLHQPTTELHIKQTLGPQIPEHVVDNTVVEHQKTNTAPLIEKTKEVIVIKHNVGNDPIRDYNWTASEWEYNNRTWR